MVLRWMREWYSCAALRTVAVANAARVAAVVPPDDATTTGGGGAAAAGD